jgi:hypothetical protein
VDEADVVKLGSERYLFTPSNAKRPRQIRFAADGNSIVGTEQNLKTKPRWAAIASSGNKVIEFIRDGRYVAVVTDGKVMLQGSMLHDA